MANINFIYDVSDETLERIVTGGVVLNQGQTNSIEFRFYFENEDGTDSLTPSNMIDIPCLINIERPDGSSSNDIATTAITTETPRYFKYIISDWVTEHSGTLTITAKRREVTANPVVTNTYGAATQNINASASVSSDTITTTQYNALTTYLSSAAGNARAEVRANEVISQLDLVMFVGTVGASGKLLVAKATQSGTPNIKDNPEYKFGIALSNANQNDDFYIQTVGLIENVDTSNFTEGKILVPSASVAGGLIEADNANAPEAPLNRTPIAAVIYSHQNNGILYVRPTIFPKMGQVKDVYVDYSSLSQGQGLVWDSSESRFKPGFSGGVFYDDNLPSESDRFDNLTYFDED